MRPTRRGAALALVVVCSVVLAWQFGQRSLNAVAAPGVALLLGAVAQVLLAGTPVVDRTVPARGFPGETWTVELSIEGGGVARIEDAIPDGLVGDGTVETTLPATRSYDVTYEQRGVHDLGPATVRVRDALGLVESRTVVPGTATVLVYPAVHSMGGPDAFTRALGPAAADRQAFDRLREYVPGDSLRDIHWTSSAKHPGDLLVREFSDRAADDAVTIVAEATPGNGDEMAAAAATLAVAALDAGYSVAVCVPGGSLADGHGEDHRERVLELLARTPAGEVGPTVDEADVFVAADDGVRVSLDGRTFAMDELIGTHENPLARGAAT